MEECFLWSHSEIVQNGIANALYGSKDNLIDESILFNDPETMGEEVAGLPFDNRLIMIRDYSDVKFLGFGEDEKIDHDNPSSLTQSFRLLFLFTDWSMIIVNDN